MKRCSSCDTEKSLDAFANRARSKDGKQAYCKACNNVRKKKYLERLRTSGALKYRRTLQKYGVDADSYLALLRSQDHSCGICKEPLVMQGQAAKSACVDHCHTTKKVRGLLCFHCNRALGLFKDSVPALQSVIDYLRNTS